MADNIGEVFNVVARDVKIDKSLLKRLSRFVRHFLTKDENHIAFFGDGLIGVYPIKYTDEDKNEWFDTVLELDEYELKDEIHSLESIDQTRKVASDVTNLSYVWLAHAILNSKDLKDKDKEEAMIDTFTMMHYKFLSSLMSHYFKYPADKAVALATYSQLNKKYALKTYGSWSALINARAEDIIHEKGIHFGTIKHFSDDDAIQYVVTDIQSRIREVVKKIMDVFYKVRENDSKIMASSSTMSVDGNEILKDRTTKYSSYRKYLQDIIHDKNDFIREEVFNIVTKVMHTMPARHLEEALNFITDNSDVAKLDYIQELMDVTVVHSFTYLNQNKVDYQNLSDVIVKMRAIYMSPRSTDSDLVKAKDYAERIVEESVTSKSDVVKAAVRTGVLLFIVLRTLTMNHYKKTGVEQYGIDVSVLLPNTNSLS